MSKTTLTDKVHPRFHFNLRLCLHTKIRTRNGFSAALQKMQSNLVSNGKNQPILKIDAPSFRHHFNIITQFITELTPEEVEVIRLQDDEIDLSALQELNRNVIMYERQMRKQAANDTLTNREGWGYKTLQSVNRYLPHNNIELQNHLYWFEIGSFVSPTQWQIDKNKLEAILKQEAQDKLLFLCPTFDFRRVQDIIRRLPDTIDTDTHKSWSIYYRDELEGNRVVHRPAGIVHKKTLENQEPAPKEETYDEQDENPEEQRFIPKVSFNEIGGLKDVISRVREVIELPLQNPGLFEYMGIQPHKGVMLYGPPGCGKTMIAKAIANDIKAHFISIKGPELLNKYYGQSEENLRKVFEEARDLQPSVIFFDEIDSIAQKRSGEESLRMDARIVNQLLTLLDGIEDYGKICVIAATNRLELIDQALLRPGRFDYMLEIPLPDAKACRKIFEITTNDMPVSDKFSLQEFCPDLKGLSGADISFVAREGAYNCLRRNINLKEKLSGDELKKLEYEELVIQKKDFQKALSKIKPGIYKNDKTT